MEQELSCNYTLSRLTQEKLTEETQATISELTQIRRGMIKKDTNPIPQIVFINNIEQNQQRCALI
jgi:hypothetical protein